MPAGQPLAGFIMTDSIFNPDSQNDDITSKVVAGLERISEVFKVLLWDKAKRVGLSPIQIQILIFVAFHKEDLCNVSHLAKEFNVTKPTISDAIKVLDSKGLIKKETSPTDSRSYSITLSANGKAMVSEIHDFADPLKSQIDGFLENDLEDISKTLNTLIYKLNRTGILTVQRTCYGCKFYQKQDSSDYCNLLNTSLLSKDIRLDCPEFEAKPTGNDS